MKLLTLSIVVEWLKALERLESDNLRWLLLPEIQAEACEEAFCTQASPCMKKPEKRLLELVQEVAALRQALVHNMATPGTPRQPAAAYNAAWAALQHAALQAKDVEVRA